MTPLGNQWLQALLEIVGESSSEEAVKVLLERAQLRYPEAAFAVERPADGGNSRIAFGGTPERARGERVLPIPNHETATLRVSSPSPLSAEAEEALALSLSIALTHGATVDRLTKEKVAISTRALDVEKLANLGRLAATIAHELNNPLTTIVASADHLERAARAYDPTDPSDSFFGLLGERLSRIAAAATRMLRFSREMVAISKPSGQPPVPTNVNDAIEQALLFCEHVVEQHGVRVTRSLGQIPYVMFREGALVQVIVNLVTNACQAMPGGGTVDLSTSCDAETVSIKIDDSGTGLPPNELERVFDPYFTTRGDRGGTGLGLHIVRSALAENGATIRATNREPRGATFIVALPRGSRGNPRR